MVELSIIILSYNTANLTISCIQSLVNHYKKELDSGLFEVFIFDNNSTDNSFEEISKYTRSHKNIHVFKNEKNYGFGKGNNIAVTKAKAKTVLFLNSDIELKGTGIVQMKDFLNSQNTIAVLGGKLMKQNGQIEKSAGRFFNLINTILMLIFGDRLSFIRYNPTGIKKVDWVSGGLMMVKKEIFEKIQGFDEHLFMYIEDMEFCYRIKKIGYTTYYYPNITAIHVGQGSSNRTFAIVNIYKGIEYFYKKHSNQLQYIVVVFLLKLKAILLLFIGYLTNNEYLKKTYSQALTVSV